MYFYHFTRKANIQSISQNGINPGITPFSAMSGNQAVSLTKTPCHERLGLIKGDILKEGIDPEFKLMAQSYPELVKVVSGKNELHLFDQTEAMIKINLSNSSSKLVTYDKLFEKDIVKGLYPNLSKDNYQTLKAVGIHSADYRFGTRHLSDNQIDQETQEIASGRKSHTAQNWFFYYGVVPVKSIVSVLYKQADGSYA